MRALGQTEVAAAESSFLEATIPQLQGLMASRQITSRELTLAYLQRISRIDPILHSVIETNPQALEIASRLDRERRAGQVRGPLHGIPILVKDNIATDDQMETTAGSLALVGSSVPVDAPIIANLRAAGAVVLGKANLSEWANFRGGRPDGIFINGWSARGGFTRNPYVLDFDPCGSSSGSAVAPAANLCAAAVGTETDGSIVCPAGNNLVVGLKPTLGLVAQQGIIPIAHSQDTAGPMARTVTDTAILLNTLVSPFGPVVGQRIPSDYTQFLRRGSLSGARIGIDRRQFLPEYFALPEINEVVEVAIEVMASLGAVIVDPVDTGDPFAYFDDETTVLLYEFKGDIANYLASLSNTSMRTLADLIAFNLANCEAEMTYIDQSIFEAAEATSGDLTDPAYLAARANCLRLARDEGINRVMREHRLDAVLSPSYAFGSSAPAVSGFPRSHCRLASRAPDGRPGSGCMHVSSRSQSCWPTASTSSRRCWPASSRRSSERCHRHRRLWESVATLRCQARLWPGSGCPTPPLEGWCLRPKPAGTRSIACCGRERPGDRTPPRAPPHPKPGRCGRRAAWWRGQARRRSSHSRCGSTSAPLS
jgi:amidase